MKTNLAKIRQTAALEWEKNLNLDKIAGCLMGGAAGDALGYTVEFLREEQIFAQYGKRGITCFELVDGKALISDDTQMTLFTAYALLLSDNTYEQQLENIAEGYRHWMETQTDAYRYIDLRRFGGLMNEPEMYASRAPGLTCLSAIRAGCKGTIEEPANNSKGCGGVMRVAPIGLVYRPSLATDLLGADAAALTHGHEMGYIPAAMLVHMVSLLSQTQTTPKQALLDAKQAMRLLFDGAEHLPAFLALIDRAVELSESRVDDLTAIHELGEGWCGDEALAIALYCALKYCDNFEKAIVAAVNHNGDSDSTGAICGNILGAYLGKKKIPKRFFDPLEARRILGYMAASLWEKYQTF